jgi:2-polyprenyl-6-methoxyphenol hydroxylase-like FAD-dependent oxidoreductase
MRVLIVGAGIAGPTLAHWLAFHGFRPTLLERASALRTGGYIVDFWGAGFDIAERMGLGPDLRRRGYVVKEVRFVGDRGERLGGFAAEVIARLTGGRYVSLPRSELSASIYSLLDDRTERIFGDEVTSLCERGSEVLVTLRSGERRSFDLVIGADGLHSSVRTLAFGPEHAFEKHLGYEVAACQVQGYRPRDESVYALHSEQGIQVGRFALRGDQTLFLFVYTVSGNEPVPRDVAGQRARVRQRFAGVRWETPQILDALDGAGEMYLERVSQIRMERWTHGRIALVGDAAYCVSLLAGQGSALAVIGATVLAGELWAANGDFTRAFLRYEERLRPFLVQKQKAAARFAGAFAPRSAMGLAFRNMVTRVLSVPGVAEWAVGRELRDEVEVPLYG